MIVPSLVLVASLVGLPFEVSNDGKRMIMNSPEGSIVTIIDEEGSNSRGDIIKNVRSYSVFKTPVSYEKVMVSIFLEISSFNCNTRAYLLKEGVMMDQDRNVIQREKMDTVIVPKKDTPGYQELEFVCKNNKKMIPNV